MAFGVNRFNLLGIPVDLVGEEELPAAVERLYGISDHRQIIFLDFHELMRARHNAERRRAVSEAALVIPVSPLILRAIRFLRTGTPPLWHPYPFVIRLLGILERTNRSVYLLGADMRCVRSSESSLRTTFPGLRIVGRYSARFHSNREADVVTAIKKSSPTLILAGKGLKGRHLWLARRRGKFAPGLSLWENQCYDVFAGRSSKPSQKAAVRFFKGLADTIIRPWRILRVFRYLLFFLLLVIERIRRSG